MKRALKILENLFFILIVILIMVGILGNLSSKSDKLYNVIKYRSYIIVSPSMKSTINPGDLIFIKKVNIDKIKEGDIITFNKDDIVATHRVIKIDDNTVTTKGDNNNIEDSPIDKKEIIGKFTFRIPKVGYVFSFAISPVGMVTIGCIIVFIFIYDFIFREKK